MAVNMTNSLRDWNGLRNKRITTGADGGNIHLRRLFIAVKSDKFGTMPVSYSTWIVC